MQITVNDIEMRYVLDSAGTQPWITFIHPLGADLSVWDQLAGYFSHRANVLRYDVRGHGKTALADGPFTIAALAGDLAALLDQLGVQRTRLVGISMGGMIAQQFALDHGARASSLVLADTSSRQDGTARAALQQRAAVARRDGMAALADDTLTRWFTPGYRGAHPEAVEIIGEIIRNTAPEGYARACEALRDFDVHERLANISVPTLVTVGKHDTSTPVEVNKALAAAIPGAQFELLDAAHLAAIEQSDRFAALLETFWQRDV